ncbi:MAG: mechanosensitive ion channel family protein [Nitrosopumilus sp.]|nr:mechanosensitive ion channel family protein [Nitrosopumilus sp.]
MISGFSNVNYVLAQEDVFEIEDKPIAIDSASTQTQTQTTFLHSWWFDGLLVSSITLIGSFIVYFVINYFLNRTADSLNLDKGELKGIRSIIKMIIIVITIIIILFQFSSINGAAAGAISVVVGTVIGFSSRNTISNAIAGIILLSARPFKIGDRISTTQDDSLLGDVVEISLIYTKIKTIKNELVTVPNQSLLQNQIVNYSGFEHLAVSIEVSIVYGNDKNKIKSLLVEAASNTSGIISYNPKPYVILKRFDNFAAVFELRAYTKRSNEFLRIQSDIRENIYDIFQRSGIDLTIPQAQINLDTANKNKEIVPKEK